MELDIKSISSVLLFLLPGYFFLQGRQRFIPARDLSTLQESAHFFISSLFVHFLLIFVLSWKVNVGSYLEAIKSASVADMVPDHLWIIFSYVSLSLIVAHYTGRFYGWGMLYIIDRGLGGWGPVILKPTLRNENFFISIIRQRHLPWNQRKRYVFVRALMKDGSAYEGFIRKYTFQEKQDFTLYIRSAVRKKGTDTKQLYWEDPPFDGVVVKSDAISSLEVSYRD